MAEEGYYRFPTIHGSRVVFVCEDDLWIVPTDGGVARRLTANLGDTSHPVFSADGTKLAFVAREEGPPEVFVMESEGGPARRLTYLGTGTSVVGWLADGRIAFASDSGQPFRNHNRLWAISPDGGLPERLPYGSAVHITFGPKGAVALGRYTRDTARWKRYRGGLAGQIWVDTRGKGRFERLTAIKGNVANPMWIGSRIYFIGDHEGIGNLYSCLPDGTDITRHTDHAEFYARHASTDGKRIVYHCGADLYLFDIQGDETVKIPVRYHSSRTQRNRKFIDPTVHLEGFHAHPTGQAISVVIRGKVSTALNWDGPVVPHGKPDGVRYRLARWLNDGKRIVALDDEEGEENLVIFHADESQPPVRMPRFDIGRPLQMAVSPKRDQVVLITHRGELVIVGLKMRRCRVLDVSKHGRIRGIAWSPDGEWLAYGYPDTGQSSIIKLLRVADGKSFPVTRRVLHDGAPSFDPDGKYLYFLSHRVFDPVYDNLHFDLSFPRGMRPHLVILRNDLPWPFQGKTEITDEPSKDEKVKKKKAEDKEKTQPLRIDLEGIEDRVVAFPIEEGRYEGIVGMPKGKVLFTTVPVEGALHRDSDGGPSSRATLHMYELAERKHEVWLEGITSFQVSKDRKHLYYRAGRRLRVVNATEKPKSDEKGDGPGRRSGWIDLSRFRISVIPAEEWKQMLREAWRLQREHYWVEHMCGIDWKTVYERYAPLVDRVGSRTEFSDLMWEMQGELGTSHAYESGGEYRRSPFYRQGFLGATFEHDPASGGYRVTHVAKGDGWFPRNSAPFRAPGVDIRVGDILLSIGGRKLDARTTPAELLVNLAGREILVEVMRPKGKTRRVTIHVLGDEHPLRYREWVETNRATVHEKSGGRVGYLHIPDMGPHGYAEFHRYYLVENRFDGLIVDVRFNGGGHVSQLLLEKLMRRRIGYCIPRWGVPDPYPGDSVLGPLVAITNERAGSDGDIFSHGFKMLGLGPLIGKRTWGGVIGIWPRHHLVDGTLTTQPEFSFWFQDVGWGVENYGTQPDIEVEMAPDAEVRGEDPQLAKAIEVMMERIATLNPQVPRFQDHPELLLPTLPPRAGQKAAAPPPPVKKRASRTSKVAKKRK